MDNLEKQRVEQAAKDKAKADSLDRQLNQRIILENVERRKAEDLKMQKVGG